VGGLVSRQLRLLDEGPSAELAHERALAGVGSFVGLKE
jgi:hypothetical protein